MSNSDEPNEPQDGDSDERPALPGRVPKPTTRRERLLTRKVNPQELAINDIVTYYSKDGNLRYYVRLLQPLARRGIAVFHFNKKGRPVYNYLPTHVIPADAECCLILRRNLSQSIDDKLFR